MILIAYGSQGGEKEISLSSANFVKECFDNLKIEEEYAIVELNNSNVIQQIETYRPRCIFNAMHGLFGEDGSLQNILDFHNIQYTHSSSSSSFVCMDKSMCKEILKPKGIQFANGFNLTLESFLVDDLIKIIEQKVEDGTVKGSRFVVKPNNLGSSVYLLGINLDDIEESKNNIKLIKERIKKNLINCHFTNFIVEEMKRGRELDVVVFDAIDQDPIVGIAEIIDSSELYTYEKKYNSGKSVVNFSPVLKPNIEHSVKEIGLKMHKELKCKDISRSEFILEEKDDGSYEIYALEINTHPGLRKESCAIKIPSLQLNLPEEVIVQKILQKVGSN